METFTSEASQAEVIVFLRTSEEAQSDDDQIFDYITPAETLTEITSSFDTTTNSLVLTATGTGFTADNLAGVTLYIDGIL
jgi:hypothetical protein